MLAKLINLETDEVVMHEKFSCQEAIAKENERAQEESRGLLQWQALTPFEIGLLTAQVAVLFGGNNHEQ